MVYGVADSLGSLKILQIFMRERSDPDLPSQKVFIWPDPGPDLDPQQCNPQWHYLKVNKSVVTIPLLYLLCASLEDDAPDGILDLSANDLDRTVGKKILVYF